MIGVEGNLFVEIGIIVIIAAITAFLLRLIKQPQILAYVLVGVLITPILGLVTNNTIIESMSIVGIAFLLFIVGIEIDFRKLRNVALVSTLGGIIQIIILFILSFVLALLFGFLTLEAVYIGLMISFSSTMVVMKLLSDKRELNTLHGRIVIGILLLEDLIAVFALSILTSLNSFSWSIFGIALLKFVTLFVFAYLANKYLFPRAFHFAAKNQELLLITSVAVCFLFSLAFYYLGFSIAIGAFLAGVTLGSLDYNLEIVGKVKSLRDFFALIFFVSLGMSLSLTVLKQMILPLIVFTIVIIFFKPLLVMTICSIFKYTKKPSFLTAISLTQIGEFSLILASQGLLLGHISQNLFSMILIIMVLTITLSTYFIKYDNWFYKILQQPLKLFDRFNTQGLEYTPSEAKPKVILCGHNRIGYSILKNLRQLKEKVLIVDYNPEIIAKLAQENYHCLYGDAADEEIIEKMHLEHITMLISTVPELNDNLFLLKKVRAVNKRAQVIVTASEIEEALKLYHAGADYVILPHFLGGDQVADLITDLKCKKVQLKDEKKKHIGCLLERQALGQEHPKH